MKKNKKIRVRNIFNPKSEEPFKLSRSKLEDFVKCPRCFYLDRRLGISKPGMPAFSINIAIDELLKKEFDFHRAKKQKHPLMKKYGINAVPFQHDKIDEWRDARFRGIQYLHKKTNLILTGGIDDVWINSKGELIIVDYKATSTKKEISLDDEYKESYKRQAEIYQWLFRQNGFKVSKTAYFVYCNGKTDCEAFDGKVEFDVQIIPYRGNDNWVEKALINAKECLMSEKIPECNEKCELCCYVGATNQIKSKSKQIL